MVHKLKKGLFLAVVILMALMVAAPAFPDEEKKEMTQEELDEATKKAIDKGMQKAMENVLAEMDKPEFWEKLNAKAVTMPPVKEKSARWQVLSQRTFIRDMRFIAKDRLFVNYLLQSPALYDISSGKKLWNFAPEGWELSLIDVVAAFSDLILIREDKDTKSIIAAIDPQNGRQLWFTASKSKKKVFQYLPVPAAGLLLAVQMEKKKVTMTALDLFTGKKRWQQSVKIKKNGHATPPLVTTRDVWHFYGGIRRFDPAAGSVRWERTDVLLDSFSPPPVLEEDSLIAIDSQKTLHLLDPEKGGTLLSKALDPEVRYTNIYPVKDRLYLRGTKTEGSYLLAALDRKTGQSLWSFQNTEPTVSNLIEVENRLYVSTPSKVLCLDRDKGTSIFAAPASQTGQTFPIRLRSFGDRIVYVGELVIAGFDGKTGKRLYFQGMTPLSQEAHLDALDNWVSVLEARIKKLSGMIWFGGASGAADAFSRQAEISQNLSNQYSSQASHYRVQAGTSYNMSASSDYSKSARLQNQAQIESAYSQATAQLGFFFAMEGMKNSMLQRSMARDRSDVARLQRIRKSILASYTAAEGGSYAYRPHVEGNWAGINLVHLPTGKAVFKPLSPIVKDKSKAYFNDRALWSIIDLEKGLIYYHGLRILQEKYQDDPPKEGLINYGIHLVAEEIKLPK